MDYIVFISVEEALQTNDQINQLCGLPIDDSTTKLIDMVKHPTNETVICQLIPHLEYLINEWLLVIPNIQTINDITEYENGVIIN